MVNPETNKPVFQATDALLATPTKLTCASVTTCKPHPGGRNVLREGFADFTETLFADVGDGVSPRFQVVETWNLNSVDGRECLDMFGPMSNKEFRSFFVTAQEAGAFYRRANAMPGARLFIDVERLVQRPGDAHHPAIAILDGDRYATASQCAADEGMTLDELLRDALDEAVAKRRAKGLARR